MKNFFSKYGSHIASVAMKVTTMTANSACLFATYQAKMPKSAKKLRKF